MNFSPVSALAYQRRGLYQISGCSGGSRKGVSDNRSLSCGRRDGISDNRLLSGPTAKQVDFV